MKPFCSEEDIRAVFTELLSLVDLDLMALSKAGTWRKDLVILALDNAQHDLLKRGRDNQERLEKKAAKPSLPPLRELTPPRPKKLYRQLGE